MVKTAEDYPRSGHLVRSCIRSECWGSWKSVLARRRRYQSFVDKGLGEVHREEFHGGTEDARILADDRFTDKVLRKREAMQT